MNIFNKINLEVKQYLQSISEKIFIHGMKVGCSEKSGRRRRLFFSFFFISEEVKPSSLMY